MHCHILKTSTKEIYGRTSGELITLALKTLIPRRCWIFFNTEIMTVAVKLVKTLSRLRLAIQALYLLVPLIYNLSVSKLNIYISISTLEAEIHWTNTCIINLSRPLILIAIRLVPDVSAQKEDLQILQLKTRTWIWVSKMPAKNSAHR